MEYLPGDKVSYVSSGGGTHEAIVVTWEEFDVFHSHADRLPERIPLKAMGGSKWIWQELITKLTPVELITRGKNTSPESSDDSEDVEIPSLKLRGTKDWIAFHKLYPEFRSLTLHDNDFVPIVVNNIFIIVPRSAVKLIQKEDNPFGLIQLD